MIFVPDLSCLKCHSSDLFTTSSTWLLVILAYAKLFLSTLWHFGDDLIEVLILLLFILSFLMVFIVPGIRTIIITNLVFNLP